MNIREIAALAGVSASTVSKILNHNDASISEKTRIRVLNVIKEHQYVRYANYNFYTDKAHSHLLAFFTQTDHIDPLLLPEVESASSWLGYGVIICNISPPYADNLHRYMKMLSHQGVEGIFLAFKDEQLITNVISENYDHLPIIAFSSHRIDSCNTYLLDYKECAMQAANRLISLGHYRIACITESGSSQFSQSFLEGYKYALHKNALHSDEIVIEFNKQNNTFSRDPVILQQLKYSGIICQSPSISHAVTDELRKCSYYCPNNYSLICASTDASVLASALPATAAYQIPLKTLAVSAAEYLIHLIEGRGASSFVSRNFSPSFIDGDSISSHTADEAQILIVGDCRLDINLQVQKLPGAGECLTPINVSTISGGKATNQAIGAGKLAGNVYIIGCVGNDKNGDQIISSLRENSVHTDALLQTSSAPTGTSYILVPPDGKSSIITCIGANDALTTNSLHPFEHLFQTSKYCLLSTELKKEINDYVITKCEKYGIKLFLKPSSPDINTHVLNYQEAFSLKWLPQITYLLPNLKELDTILPGNQSYEEKADFLYSNGCQNVLITLGDQGSYLRNRDYALHIPAAEFPLVDSTGAANIFMAALAVSLSQNSPLLYAICYATFAAGFSVTQIGVQTSFPTIYQMAPYLDAIQTMYKHLLSKIEV